MSVVEEPEEEQSAANTTTTKLWPAAKRQWSRASRVFWWFGAALAFTFGWIQLASGVRPGPFATPQWINLLGYVTALAFVAVSATTDNGRINRLVVRGSATSAAVVIAAAAIASIGWFAAAYLQMSGHDPSSFSQPLTRVSSLYFAVATMTTTGFGDISAASDTAQLAVTFQMVIDMTFLIVAVGLLFIRVGRSQAQREEDHGAAGDAA